MPSPFDFRISTTQTTKQPLQWWRDLDPTGWASYIGRTAYGQQLDADMYGKTAGIVDEEDVLGALAAWVADGLSPLEAARVMFVPEPTRQALWGTP